MTSVSSIHKRQLGQTDFHVTPIGLGVMQFSGNKGIFRFMFDDIQQNEMNAIVETAFEGGINWFDTAELYGNGRSEQGLATALRNAGIRDEDVIIATKWFPILRTARNIPHTIQDRIHYLSGYSIDLYMVHQPWGFSSPQAEMNAMADLVENGLIRSVGVSNFNADRMRRAHDALAERGLPLAVNQVQYSLIDRSIETNGVLQAAKDLGVTIVAWSPLGSGLLSGKYHKNPRILSETPLGRRRRLDKNLERTRPLITALEDIAERYDATPAQVALNWLINFQGDSVVAIPGASKVGQSEDNAGAMKFTLSQEELSQLDELSQEYL